MLTPTPRLPRAVLVASLLALLITLVLALDLSPVLRGGAGWRWPYEVPADPLRLAPGMAALVAYLGIGWWWVSRLDRAREGGGPPTGLCMSPAIFLAFCALGGFTVQLAFLSFDGPPLPRLFERTVSSVAGGFYEVGVAPRDMLATLRDYPALMPHFTAHPKAHPPGIPLLFWVASRLFALFPGLADALADLFRPWQCHHRLLMALPDSAIAAAALGMSIPLLSLLAVFPLYDLARRSADYRVARRSALWLPLVPAIVMFTPQWNQLYALLAMLTLWLTHRALAELRPWMLGLAGLLLSAATFLSFTNVNLLGLTGLYGLLYAVLVGRHVWSGSAWRQVLLGSALFALALPVAWAIFYIVSGVTIFDLLHTALTIHYGLNEPYAPWLLFFPLDLFLFSGLALAILALIGGAQALRAVIRAPHVPHPQAVLPLTLWIAVIVLDLSGLVRGEVGRLLLWIMPLVVIMAARAVVSPPPHAPDADSRWQRGFDGEAMINLALAFQLVVMVGFLRVIGTELAPPPVNPSAFLATGPDARMPNPAQARFDAPPSAEGSADLVGYEASFSSSEDRLELALYWQAGTPFDHAYFVSAVVVDSSGAPVGSYDWLPVEGGYPTSCWRPGEVIVDRVQIPLNEQPTDEVWISVALFDYDTRERLPVSAPDRPPDTQVGLGPVPVP